jgi:GDPmannose 4,6-dehydratase
MRSGQPLRSTAPLHRHSCEEFLSVADATLAVERLPVVRVDLRYVRPIEVDMLSGDPSRSKRVFEWEPEYDLEKLCADVQALNIAHMRKYAYLMTGDHIT